MDLHLVKDKMCHLDVFWAKSGLVATFCLPVCSPLVRLSSTNPLCPPSNPQRKPTWNMEPNEFNLWEHQLQHIHHKIVTFVFLLLLVALSISFLVCWYLLSFPCRLLFLSSLSGFLPVAAYFGRLCDEHGTQHISKNKSRPFLGGVLVSVLSPPQTWNLNSF